ncbi:MAG: hypothetical protein V4596_06200 [Bdellovibrionota bacterium]
MNTKRYIFVLFMFWSCFSIGADLSSYPQIPESGGQNLHTNLLKEFEVELGKLKSTATRDKVFRRKNEELLSDLQKVSKRSKSGLTESQAQDLNGFLIQHPIAGDQGIRKYSGKNSMLGFCFGRATLAHLELLRRGVSPKDIRKIFVLGEMQYQKEIWELHVATVVKKADGGWWVLDGLFGKALELKEWYPQLLKIALSAKHPKIRIYVADPVKFLPISGAYNKKEMLRAEYNGFFKDLSDWIESHPAKRVDI